MDVRVHHIQGVSEIQMRCLFAPAEQYVYSPEVSQTPHSSGVLCLKNCPKFTIIIAQALNEDMPIIGVDTRFDDYDVSRAW